MNEPNVRPLFSREVKAKVRRRAYALSALSYDRMVSMMEQALRTKALTPDGIDSWTPEEGKE